MSTPEPITVFIHAHDRPLYLWASLDSLYRGTAHPHRFVLFNMASDDPLVRQVVAGFERRGMFSEVIWWPRNDMADFWELLWRRLPTIGPYFAYCQADVIVAASQPCWLSVFAGLMRADPRLAMLGSAIDRSDFIDLEAARRIAPELEGNRLEAMIKWDSPERSQDAAAASGPIFSPHSPAGRLLMLRSSALARVGAGDDSALHQKFLAAGFQTGIATAVRHRHLSLLHLFDYPDYDYDRRNTFWRG